MGNGTDDGPSSSREQLDPRLTPREDKLARNHAAVIERLQREGVPIPAAPE